MIEQSIRDKALTYPKLSGLINRRFYHTTGHKASDKYIVLQVLSDTTPVGVHLEDSQSEAQVQFDCYSKSPQTAKQIASAVKSLFNKQGFRDNYHFVQLAIQQNRTPSFNPATGLHRITLDYLFLYNERSA